VKRWRVVAAAALMAGLPTAAYLAAPAQAIPVASAPSAGAEPASDLAGFNTNATSAAVQLQLLLPGLVPLRDPTKRNFIQASIPYSNSTSSTGPSNGSVTSPAWPGDAIATAGNAVGTFAPTAPVALIKLLNDPVVARSSFPDQVGVGTSGSFGPGSPAAIGSATTKSSESGTSGAAHISDLTPLGANKAGVPLIDIASASSMTTSTVQAASVSNRAETRIGRISIAGVITIDGINTTATASSDGKGGTSDATTDIGAVKVAGLSASIGPDGITINGKGQGDILVKTANKLLATLQKIGISITALAPQKNKDGNEADATSGAILVSFEDDNLPDLGKLAPQLPVPLPNSLGMQVSLGLSHAKAAATLLTDVEPPEVGTPTTAPVGPGSDAGPIGTGDGGLPPVDAGTSTPPIPPPVVAAQPQAAVLGVPVRTAWVVVALLIALLIAGPLLTYANWQLLRGRTP
jgi:hypothetical protein